MPKSTKNDISGKRFQMLTAIKFLPDLGKYAAYLFECDCGIQKRILAQSVVHGFTVSCGCFQKEQAAQIKKVHGHSGLKRTKTYNSWAGMMDRCEWGGHPSYAKYGAKGIRVAPQWFSFECFLKDMGERPDGTSIDRKDNKKGYSPENCRWATRQEQALNTSRTIKIVYQGEIIAFHTLCEQLNLPKKAIRARAVRRGNNYVEALKSIGVFCE
jgi:hypothetical protein